MKFYFDPNQDYQLQAISSFVDKFERQPFGGGEFEFAIAEGGLQSTKNASGNSIVLL